MSGYDAIIVGGGPAGSAAAISLSGSGARVLLLEEKHMPRGKLCGEFITPESFPSLERLGVTQRMLSSGAQRIARARLVVSSGKSVETYLSSISEDGTWAMSLSRSRFDQILFDRARETGVECLEGVAVKGCLFGDGVPRGVEARLLPRGTKVSFDAPLIIDASGRNSRLMLGKRERTAGRHGSRLYAMKAHLEEVHGIEDQVELHFFPQGYGGLSRVEDGLANLCFIVDERTLRSAAGDPAKVLEISLMNNKVARDRLRGSRVVGKWYSAGPLTFGRKRLARDGVLAIGDASGMIDPFTGTGIQMALRTGEMAADAICEVTGGLPVDESASDRPVIPRTAGLTGQQPTSIMNTVLQRYSIRYAGEFGNRLKAAGLLRGVAFSPVVARLAAEVLTRAPGLTRLILRATRSTHGALG